MKYPKNKTIGILFIALLLSMNTFAQRGNKYRQSNGNGQGYFCNNIPNLSAEQQTKISELRTTHWKEMQNNRNQLTEKRARLQTLRSVDKVDMNSINKTIDEIGAVQTKMQKNREQHIQDVRNILDSDQKVYFDNSNRGRRNCQSYGRGNGNGYGRGKGRCNKRI